MKPQSMRGSRFEEESWEECRCVREEGVSAQRRKTCFPPQQKPAAPILRLEVGKGGADVRRDMRKEVIRGLQTEILFAMKKGMALYIV